jgi:uncharacterized surface protein with fasciclin (FAS1) repeats
LDDKLQGGTDVNRIQLASAIVVVGAMLLSGGVAGTQARGTELEPRHQVDEEAKMQAQMTRDIVETAVAAGSFKTLVKAVEVAGLVATLKGAGPYTVFAPTDDAFAKLPAGTVDNLLKDKQKLTAILTYHVVAGKVMAADVTKLKSAKTVNGQELTITMKDGAVMVDNAKVIRTDVSASNGVIHVIDSVVLPK